MASKEYMCAIPWVQLGAFQVHLRTNFHLRLPSDSLTGISFDESGGAQ